LEIVISDSGERFVRGVFNDEVRNLFAKGDPWFPYDDFVKLLDEASISHEQYDNDCINPPPDVYQSMGSVLTESELLESRKEMQEEIQATLGKSSKET
jgi:hypothetical protein